MHQAKIVSKSCCSGWVRRNYRCSRKHTPVQTRLCMPPSPRISICVRGNDVKAFAWEAWVFYRIVFFYIIERLSRPFFSGGKRFFFFPRGRQRRLIVSIRAVPASNLSGKSFARRGHRLSVFRVPRTP